ncbi:DUF421 domain-containing protein [Neobacillus sp. GCM10023253]|uniref:DUF421 domain-containing protein n=1 Tax=Neobacillus sp. GCM10023253 TaxID=3252644 RepID=UPI00361AC70B
MVEIFARAVGAFVVLFLLTRLLGRKQVSQLTFFNYITGISIGTIAGSLTVDPTLKISSGFVSLLTWCGLTLLVAFFDVKSRSFRKVIEGEPVIVIKQGKILEHVLKKQRLDMDELQVLLRNKDVFSIEEVDYAILETNGELSVLLKEQKQPLRRGDLPPAQAMGVGGTQAAQIPIPIQVIADGKIIDENLQPVNLNIAWVHEQLAQAGTDLSEVFYAELQKDGTLYIDKNTDHFVH